MVQYCPDCGNEAAEEDKFCIKCGKSLAAEKNKPNNISTSSAILVLVGFFLLLSIVINSLIIVVQGRDLDSTKTLASIDLGLILILYGYVDFAIESKKR